MGLREFITDMQASGELPSNFTLTPITPRTLGHLWAKLEGASLKDTLRIEAVHAHAQAELESLHAAKRLGLLSDLASVPDGIDTLEKLDAYLGIDERDMWGNFLHVQEQE